LILVFVKLIIINLTFIFKYNIFIVLGLALPTALPINSLINFVAIFPSATLATQASEYNDSYNHSFVRSSDINAEQKNILAYNNINNVLSFKQ
jgi:hypothetical protein